MLTGEYRNTIDDKGRIIIPSRFRADLNGEMLVVTRAVVDPCLWIMPPALFETLRERIMGGPAAMFDKRLRLLQRRIISPAQECELDKSGRINISSSLRTPLGMDVKEEVVLLGTGSYLEVWNPQALDDYFMESEADFNDAAQMLSEELKQGWRV